MKNKGYILVLTTALISGFSIFLNKFAVSLASPYIFTFLKNTLVALFLTAIIVAARNISLLKALSKKQLLLLSAVGLMGGSIPFLMFFKGLTLTTAAEASFIQKTMFIWIFILASVFLKEKITRGYLLAGLALIAANVMLLNISQIKPSWGTLLIFLATVFWAIENVISKYLMAELPAKIVVWARMFFGSIFILVFLAATHQLAPIKEINSSQIWWVIFTGVLLFGYVSSWYAGLKHIKVSEAALILMLGSPVTTILATVFNKPASLAEYLSGLLIILGIILALKIKRTKPIEKNYVSVRS